MVKENKNKIAPTTVTDSFSNSSETEENEVKWNTKTSVEPSFTIKDSELKVSRKIDKNGKRKIF